MDGSVLSFVGIDATGKLLKTLDEHGHSISSMAWSRKGDFLLTGSYNNTVIIWDTRTWKSKQELTFDSGDSVLEDRFFAFLLEVSKNSHACYIYFLQNYCVVLNGETILHLQLV